MIDCDSADTWIRHYQWHAMEMLTGHELLSETYWNNGRHAAWTIGKRGTGVFLTEIIAGICGSLVVHGDFDTSRFAYYGDDRNAWARLLWMADCRDVGYYVAQKAAIGTRRGDVDEYDGDVARYDIRATIRDAERNDYAPEFIRLLEESLEYADEKEELQRFLHEGDKGWDLWEYSFGKVLSPHVIINHVALNKCAWLLRARHGELGPRQCLEQSESSPRWEVAP